ncbi:MAG: PorV/PorQ family protein, partial [Bacteroidota bacterium]
MRQFTLFLIALSLSLPAFAGNPERTAQNGGNQLLVNPFARSSGMAGLDASISEGIESYIVNPAGVAHNEGTEILFAHTRWLVGSDIAVNAAGFSQKLGENGGTIGIGIVAFDFGEIQRTTIDNPDGGLGTFSPTFANLGVTYGKEMVEDRIFVGVNFKIITESVPDATALGAAFDAGVQYRDRTGKFKIGVALRNIGPTMRYSGDGLATRARLGGSSVGFDNAVSINADDFELPSTLTISTAYDIELGAQGDTIPAQYRLTPVATFVSNAFGRDQIGGGLEFGYKDFVSLRVAHFFETDIFDDELIPNVQTGLAAGASFLFPLGRDSDTQIGVDYSYRHTYLFNGIH